MIFRKRILIILLAATFAVTFNTVLASPSIFGHFKIVKSPEEIEAEKTREAFLTDSLLNTIKVDSTINEAYAMFPPSLIAPNILTNLGETQFNTIIIPPVDYTDLSGVIYSTDSTINIIYPAKLPPSVTDPIPDWFKASVRFRNQVNDASMRMMISNPATVEYADWNLPSPPRLPKEDFSFHAFLKRLNLPEILPSDAIIPDIELPRKNWLHYFNVALQVSQAYVSNNWYQGGNSYVSGLFNFTWNVNLNQVYHPKLLFQSSLQYKLAVNSNPKGSFHKYNTAQDLFQYTLKTGLKAFNHWFYSLNVLFNTQLFNSYPEDSYQRTSSFLSPGTLNLGVGMTYNLTHKGLTLTASISPLAYNLKTCIAKDIDHLQFNIKPDRKTVSEIGSSAEVNLTWNFNENISWKSRLFMFTDYSYFLTEWENTFNFQLNKFLSTQIYLYPRFDSSSEWGATKWHYWMFREILSFGISYTFETAK